MLLFKQNIVHFHDFWTFTQFYHFSAAILDLAAILNLFTIIMVHYDLFSCLLYIKCHPFKILFLFKKINQFSLFLAAILGFGGHLELPRDARLASIRF